MKVKYPNPRQLMDIAKGVVAFLVKECLGVLRLLATSATQRGHSTNVLFVFKDKLCCFV